MKRDTLPDCIRYKGRTYRRSDTKDRITYPRKKVLAVLRTLNEFVVSLDRIGSASYDMAKVDNNAALADFIERHKIFRKMAQARAILSKPFSTKLGADGMEDLEREMQAVRYWKPRIKKRR